MRQIATRFDTLPTLDGMLPRNDPVPPGPASRCVDAADDRQLRVSDLYLLLVRLLLGYVFASAGLAKLTQGQFGGLIGPPTAAFSPGLESVWPFLALSQVAVGALVLSGRWALLGLLALVPMNAGILAYTLANHWSGTSYANAFLLLLNVTALLAEWRSLRFFLFPEALPCAAPRMVQLWPGWRLPLIACALLLAASAAGFGGSAGVLVSVVLGASGITVAWVHGLRARGLSAPERAAVAVTGIAVLWLSIAPMINRQSAPAAILLGLTSGAAAVVMVSIRRRWTSRRRAD